MPAALVAAGTLSAGTQAMHVRVCWLVNSKDQTLPGPLPPLLGIHAAAWLPSFALPTSVTPEKGTPPALRTPGLGLLCSVGPWAPAQAATPLMGMACCMSSSVLEAMQRKAEPRPAVGQPGQGVWGGNKKDDGRTQSLQSHGSVDGGSGDTHSLGSLSVQHTCLPCPLTLQGTAMGTGVTTWLRS